MPSNLSDINFIWTAITNVISGIWTFYKDRRDRKKVNIEALNIVKYTPNKRLKTLIEKFITSALNEEETQEFIFLLKDIKREQPESSDLYFYADNLIEYLTQHKK